MNKIKVQDLFNNMKEILSLFIKSGEAGLSRDILLSEVNSLGLCLCGHLVNFSSECIQLYGKSEHSYLETLPQEKRYDTLKELFKSCPQIPCIIAVQDIEPHEDVIRLTQEYSIPLICTHTNASRIKFELAIYLEKKLSPSQIFHGVLMEVYGSGVLILGRSGIGKSECALELLKRGHMFVGDDVVEIMLRPGGILIGSGKELVRHHIEVRGLGIIDVRSIFGIGATIDMSKIDLVANLEEWDPNSDYDRLGIDKQSINIIGIDIPKVTIPVLPGRDISALVEVAALNQRLRNKGHYTAEELNKKLIKIMDQKKNRQMPKNRTKVLRKNRKFNYRECI